MALIVETGTGASDSESYAAIATINTYALAHGLTFPIATADEIAAAEQAARRATQWIDGTYRTRFPGYPLNGRDQALEWPRANAYEAHYPNEYIPNDEIPGELIDATCEAAVRELASPVSLMPDLERGGDIKRLKAGSVEVEYGARAITLTVFTTIDRILAPILKSAVSSFSGRAIRG